MKAQKYDLVRVIGLVRDVVRKKALLPSLECVLVRDGYFTGSNGELTVQVWLEEAVGESFLLPASMMDMIKTLPDGIVEITCDADNVLTLKAGKIKQRCKSFPVDDYAYYKTEMNYENEITLPGEAIMSAISRVAYAAAEKENTTMMNGICFEVADGKLNVVALDGHVIAWDMISYDGESNMKVIVPKGAAQKLASLGIVDTVSISYSKASIIFRSGDYTVSSRLLAGEYFKFKNFFKADWEHTVTVDRKALAESMKRAKLCLPADKDSKKPVVFQFDDDVLSLTLMSEHSNYEEQLEVHRDRKDEFRIGFNPVLVEKSLAAFGDAEVVMHFINKKAPMLIEEDASPFRALVLPVNLN